MCNRPDPGATSGRTFSRRSAARVAEEGPPIPDERERRANIDDRVETRDRIAGMTSNCRCGRGPGHRDDEDQQFAGEHQHDRKCLVM
jgi:hypothetical protein